ncbi:MMPL family transporter [Yinghuangia seranimata]|uniref:MMPL family transporter n=1 Tax=Yinghuangia seranimata TaxID=408067 RepID=UPI00248C5B2B|nr:MMPL family transporter [Yinghuangia seranimata]MDI2126383.1 MMPL family transporter [Yinghuangia seranimata]
MASRRNLAASMGGWSARHRKTAVFAWLAFVVLAVVIGGMVGSKELSEGENTPGEAGRAERIIEDAGVEYPASEMVLISSTTLKADDPAFHAAVDDTVARITAAKDKSGAVAMNVRGPYGPGGAISQDRGSVLVQFDMAGKHDDATDHIDPVIDAVKQVKAAHPQLTFDELGDATSEKWFKETMGNDFKTAEWTAVPLALGILLIAFGAVVAALLPVALAMTAFIAAGGLLALGTRLLPTTDSTMSVMLLIGLAVGVDYCLFYIRREREERAKGRSPERALEIAAATSGRSVLVSGITVMVAMAGMMFSGLAQFQSMAFGTILVVLTAMIGSVTVLPALLSMLHDKVDAGKIPGLGRMRRPSPEGGRFWGAILRTVLRRPVVWAVASAGLLVALALPALDMKLSLLPLDKELPKDSAIVQTYTKIDQKFPGGPAPADVVIKTRDINAADFKAALEAFKKQAVASGVSTDQIETRTFPGKTDVMTVEVPFKDPDHQVAALHTLRDTVIPDTLGKVKGLDAPVSGRVAETEDFNHQLDKTTPIAFGFVLLFAFLLMLVSFRSLTIALTAIVLNLLSVGAAYGVLGLVFQHGYGDNLVGTDAPGAITSWLPLFLFVVLFGLSMDYHVFVVSRIREAYDKGMDTKSAVAHGVRSTAGVVTSAAVIMVAVFAVFGTLSMQQMKQMGVGLAVAVLLDATIIRAVLLPAVMGLLGERNWYLPKWLGWLPQLDHGADDAAPPAPVREPVLAGGRHAAPYAGYEDVSGSTRLPRPPVG